MNYEQDWQRDLIRRALRHYLGLGRGYDGMQLKLTGLVAGITERAGIDIPYEVVRKFYAGVKMKDGSIHYPYPRNQKHIDAIVEFLVDPEDPNSPLSLEDLQNFEQVNRAPLHLVHYLHANTEVSALTKPQSLNGKFVSYQHSEKTVVVKTLLLSNTTEDGVALAKYSEEIFETSDAVSEEVQFGEMTLRRRNSHSGWLVLTPEDNMIAFLKHDRSGKNRYFISLAFNQTVLEGEELNLLVLYDQDLPLELSESDENASDLSLAREVQHEIGEGIMVLRRSNKDLDFM